MAERERLSYRARASGTGPFTYALRSSEGGVLPADVSFDPVRNTIPGLEVSDWVRRLREPSYRTARLSRADEPPTHQVR